MDKLEYGIAWIVENWNKIPDNKKTDLTHKRWSQPEKLTDSEHVVVLILDRQKPSVPQSYDFHEERIGVNKEGKIFWGFDSGCSCPSPWENGLDCYTCTDTWKQFEVELSAFDEGALEECIKNIDSLKSSLSA